MASSSKEREHSLSSAFVPCSPLPFGPEVGTSLFACTYGGGDAFRKFNNVFSAHVYPQEHPLSISWFQGVMAAANHTARVFWKKDVDDRFGDIPNVSFSAEKLTNISYEVVVTQVDKEAAADHFNFFFHGSILRHLEGMDEVTQLWTLIGVRDCHGFIAGGDGIEDPSSASLDDKYLTLADQHAHLEREELDLGDGTFMNLEDWRIGSDMARVYLTPETPVACGHVVCLDPHTEALTVTLAIVLTPNTDPRFIESLKKEIVSQKPENGQDWDTTVVINLGQKLAQYLLSCGTPLATIRRLFWLNEFVELERAALEPMVDIDRPERAPVSASTSPSSQPPSESSSIYSTPREESPSGPQDPSYASSLPSPLSVATASGSRVSSSSAPSSPSPSARLDTQKPVATRAEFMVSVPSLPPRNAPVIYDADEIEEDDPSMQAVVQESLLTAEKEEQERKTPKEPSPSSAVPQKEEKDPLSDGEEDQFTKELSAQENKKHQNYSLAPNVVLKLPAAVPSLPSSSSPSAASVPASNKLAHTQYVENGKIHDIVPRTSFSSSAASSSSAPSRPAPAPPSSASPARSAPSSFASFSSSTKPLSPPRTRSRGKQQAEANSASMEIDLNVLRELPIEELQIMLGDKMISEEDFQRFAPKSEWDRSALPKPATRPTKKPASKWSQKMDWQTFADKSNRPRTTPSPPLSSRSGGFQTSALTKTQKEEAAKKEAARNKSLEANWNKGARR